MKAKTLILVLMLLFFSGCTYGRFNAETKEFSFWSTKEFDSFEVIYQRGKDAITVKAKKVKAFEGQKIIVEAVKAGVCDISPLPSCPKG